MQSRRVLLPEGVQDLLIDDCIYRRYIEDKLMDHFIKSGYMQVSSPTLEYYDLFSRDYLAKNGDKMFKLIDTNGSILVLRPDCTVPIARMVSTKMKNFVYPLKLCYVENVFRIDEEQAGKKREFRQAGIEIFGIPSYRADAEVIITAIEALKELGLEDFQIDVGQVQLLQRALKMMNIGEEEKESLLYHMENKNFIALVELIEELSIQEELKVILKELPRLFGEPKEVLEGVKKLPLTVDMLKAVEELEKIWNILKEYGLGEYISLDLGMVTHLKYYSGVIFKGFTKDLGVVLLSGGRYDHLLKDFGMDCPATGFAFLVNKITKALKIQEKLRLPKRKHILIIGEEGKESRWASVLKALKGEGHIVELNLTTDKKDLLEYIQRRNIDEVVKIDENGRINIIEDLGVD